ncbi:uncharacterized protein LOC111069128 [Drosophila obscura]|uniref:uncharacterized protein LOC111069128 n=1 Tax=Drosophila obscura TaxID=7282 RepID=UPI000BA11F90|nr:uncharacterized protein LOC111069128 [Drosophila obscura]
MTIDEYGLGFNPFVPASQFNATPSESTDSTHSVDTDIQLSPTFSEFLEIEMENSGNTKSVPEDKIKLLIQHRKTLLELLYLIQIKQKVLDAFIKQQKPNNEKKTK